MLKKLICLASLFTTFSIADAHPSQAQAVPALAVEGNRLIKPDGTPVTLRGVSLCSLEWHKPLEQIESVSGNPGKWKANVLRLPVQVVEWKRVGAQNYFRDYLDPAIAACRKNNIYCIIDWHDIAAWNDSKTGKQLEEFWGLAAPRYASYPNVLYEVFNEPTDPGANTKENWLAWRTKMQRWIDQIRKDAPNTVLLIGSPHWSQMPSFAVENPLKGKNLTYVMHLYPNWNKNDWDRLMGDASASIPIFVSEWGWTSSPKAWWGIKGTKGGYAEPFKKYVDDRPSINWTAWSYDPRCSPAMLGTDKEMGAFVKQWLDEAN